MLTPNLPQVCIVISIALMSCTKDASITVAEELSKPKIDKELKHCEITRIVGYEPFLISPRVFTFEYNSKGDPVRITPTLVSTGSPKHEFRYDNKGRLTDYIGPYNNGFFEFWHVYRYDNKDRIVSDSVYIFGKYGVTPTNDFPSLRQYITYEYDEQDRIKKATSGASVQEFNYDNNGNRMVSGITYDNNPNPLRTNKIWMFLNRDYSVNNPWSTAVYNNNNLPATLVVPHNRFFIVGSLFPQFIEYACKGGHGNSN